MPARELVNNIDIPHVGRLLGLTPVPAAIMTTLRWPGGGISLSCRKGPCSCTAGLSKSWKAETDVPLEVCGPPVALCVVLHELAAVD